MKNAARSAEGVVLIGPARRERWLQQLSLDPQVVSSILHTPRGEIRPPANPAIQIWTSGKIAELVVRLGLGERVEQMRA